MPLCSFLNAGSRGRLSDVLETVFKGHDFDLTMISHVEPMDLDIYARPDYYIHYAKPDYVALMDKLKAAVDGITVYVYDNNSSDGTAEVAAPGSINRPTPEPADGPAARAAALERSTQGVPA